MTIMWSTMLVPASLRDPADRLQFGMSDFLRRNRQQSPTDHNGGRINSWADLWSFTTQKQNRCSRPHDSVWIRQLLEPTVGHRCERKRVYLLLEPYRQSAVDHRPQEPGHFL